LALDFRVPSHQAEGQDLDVSTAVLLHRHADGHGIVDAGVRVDDEFWDDGHSDDFDERGFV
jgi:hypothetical protein